MNFDEYQEKAKQTAQYPKLGHKVVYPALGLAGEAGEVAEKVKKLMRNNDGKVDKEFIESLTKELGDVLWYISQVATELNIELNLVAEKNIEKLADRASRKKIKSTGDNR